MRNAALESLLLQVIPQIGYDFCAKYKFPLLAFFTFDEDHEEVRLIVARGLHKASLEVGLQGILNNDPHLRKCCGNADSLAKTIDILFLKKLPSSAFPDGGGLVLGFAGDPIEEALGNLDHQLYEQGDLRKLAYFHLFNVRLHGEQHLVPPYEGWHLLELEETSIPRLLGESSTYSFISPTTNGTWFLVSEDSSGFDSEGMYAWLSRRWKDAAPFRAVMQYAIEQVLDIDYVVPLFHPTWVNEVHKIGLYFLGTPRRDSIPSTFYGLILQHDQDRINRMWAKYLEHQGRISDRSSQLGKAIAIAREFFEDFHRKESRAEQFASLMIALEALYTPQDQREHTFRISQNCALLTCNDHEARRLEVFQFVKSMFARRGKLFHGQYDSQAISPGAFVNDEEIMRLASLVRNSILKFTTLFIRGENDLEQLRTRIEKSVLSENLRDELFEKSDFEALMEEVQTEIPGISTNPRPPTN